ncbi:MAG: hypothetical protein KBS47_04585, partial [Bacteroidales bacterium]|nr:hypothetical protein [Candidatus Equimonas enterica]
VILYGLIIYVIMRKGTYCTLIVQRKQRDIRHNHRNSPAKLLKILILPPPKALINVKAAKIMPCRRKIARQRWQYRGYTAAWWRRKGQEENTIRAGRRILLPSKINFRGQ